MPRTPGPAGLAAGLLAVVLSLWITGLLLAPLLTVSGAALTYFNGLLYPVVLLSGFITQTFTLPFPLRVAAGGVAPYWGFRVLSATVSPSQHGLGFPMLGLVVVAVAYVAAFGVITRLLSRRMRKAGTWLV
jgi:hypothetical protein